jgi:signal peptidase II
MTRPAPAHRSLAFWLLLAAAIVAADQLTKLLVVQRFAEGEWLPLTSYFSLVRAHNPGAAFSLLADAGGWQRWLLSGIAAGAAVFIVWLLRRHPGQTLFCTAITLILGGALGNLVDRLVYGHVVDFLQFRFGFLEPLFHGGFFPSFNVADMAITAGAASLIVDELLRWRRERRAQRQQPR